jgi:hypothetical protein
MFLQMVMTQSNEKNTSQERRVPDDMEIEEDFRRATEEIMKIFEDPMFLKSGSAEKCQLMEMDF